MTRVLVTGAAGFLGSHIVRSYLDNGTTVVGAGHRAATAIRRGVTASPRLELVELDICDPAATLDVLSGVDLVIHAAARISAYGAGGKTQQERVNVAGTRNVIDACLRNGIPRLIYISTTATIGIPADQGRPADETFRFNLQSLKLGYNATKHQAEQLVLQANCPDLETVVVNPGYIFGRDGDGYRGAQTIEPALRKSLVVCTNGGLSIVHVDDVVAGISRAAADGRAGERYILSGDNVTFADIARTVARQAGRSVKVLVIPDLVRDIAGAVSWSLATIRQTPRPLHLSRRYACQFYSSGKARHDLDYNPRPFEEIVVDYLRCTGRSRC